ncbi:hypothetical protein [Oerskovia paurometabola]|uniref:Uncharacterized protein n=1 Tax=Oerskovia paurometabola TaxID=162170 RepID=A0ABW1XA70_9CELL|nr:hypothetical protein [Oerskovia paurometabola]MBM7495776.1 hypothetical protein [Oerskovia paurometabola]
MTVDLRTAAVRAVAAADDGVGYFVVADGRLFLTDGRGPEAEVVCELPNIREEWEGGYWQDNPLELRLYVHGPWVCVTENYGEHATLVNTSTGLVREFFRTFAHYNPLPFSAGFLERDGRTLLIAQTGFNRLDIFDAETGDLLTDREMYSRTVGEPNEEGVWKVESKNWSWLRTGSLHVAPSSAYFLCEAYQMQDTVGVYSVDGFLQGWEASATHIDGRGMSTTRPLTFIDDTTFAMAMDDLVLGEFFWDEEDLAEQGYEYKQLGIFTIPSPLPGNGWIDPVGVDCDAFPLGKKGEVRGELHYDPVTGHLVALNAHGAFLVRLDGSVVERLPGLSPSLGVFDDGEGEGWRYAADRRVFYRWRDGVGIEERSFSWAGAPDGASGRPGLEGVETNDR